MRKNVLLLETVAEEALAVLREHVNVFTGYDLASRDAVVAAEEIHAVITRGKMKVDDALMAACPQLEAVARCGVGLDNVDVAAASARKIRVINAPGSNAATIAEHTLALMLMLMRDLYTSVEKVKQENWNWRNQYAGDELNGKTLGILGMGNIGKRVARLASAFGMEVVYWSRSAQDLPYKFLPMQEVLRQSDIISLHLPLESGLANLIGKAELASMKPGAMLVNTARGALIDHAALLDALNEGTVAGFAADVLPDEPPVQNLGLVRHPRALVTPHSASLTATTYREMCLSTVNNVIALLSGREPEKESVFNRNTFV
ncbi:NAD(P)-dependent oxidoreductase [uncultured Chitinophaga sp.]|uniref:2-hydroxyacid dehydrogenase n=1 Tax=uncultured Chitinophaga sp. TaxID=339340 RepID=UPI002612C585|nr:NAD(P)-dependent oxidoreductase [uncultured Chitinophaga sp.]